MNFKHRLKSPRAYLGKSRSPGSACSAMIGQMRRGGHTLLVDAAFSSHVQNPLRMQPPGRYFLKENFITKVGASLQFLTPTTIFPTEGGGESQMRPSLGALLRWRVSEGNLSDNREDVKLSCEICDPHPSFAMILKMAIRYRKFGNSISHSGVLESIGVGENRGAEPINGDI